MSDKPASAAADGKFLGTFRQLAAELRHLRTGLDALGTALHAVSIDATDDGRRHEASVAKQTLEHAVKVSKPEMETLLVALASELDRHADERDYWGDQVTEVKLHCEEALYLLDRALDGKTTRLPSAGAIDAVRRGVDEALLTIAYTTVPPRLNQYLRNYRNGQVLRFDKTFAEELLDDHVGKVLDYLHNQPRCVNGIVDVQHKTVTKVAPEAWRHVVTFGCVLLLATMFVVGPLLLRHLSGASTWFDAQPKNSALAGGIVVTYLGGMTHVILSAVKQVRTSIEADDSRRFVSIDNWIVWAAAHETDLVVAVVTLGILGAYFAGGRGETDMLKLVAIGYAADSVIDVVTPKFEHAIARRTEVVA